MSQELMEIAEMLRNAASDFNSRYRPAIAKITDAVAVAQKSWSGSNLGYHSLVYYRDLAPRPPGARFSIEWGLRDMSFSGMGSVGEWCEYDFDFVKDYVHRIAGNPDLAQAQTAGKELGSLVENAKDDLLSAISVVLEAAPDEFLERMKGEASKVKIRDARTWCHAMLPSGRLASRDSEAIMTGLQVAPHQQVLAEALSITAAADEATILSDAARKVGSHLARKQKGAQLVKKVGVNIFIGHGRSPLWRELKDFIVERLGLHHEEFNRVSVAGVTNIARLSDMLESASCAFIVLTAEDELKEGKFQARMNVIHEVGLFQGRLGFEKAIVVLEAGCEEFSNIQGLGQIRFPSGKISAAFDQIRAVLEREGFL